MNKIILWGTGIVLGTAGLVGFVREPVPQPANVISAPVVSEIQPIGDTSVEVETEVEIDADVKSDSYTELSNDNYYTNSAGNEVHSPAYSDDGVPPGASAICRDGTYSFSQSRRGTCSHHGGVAQWLH
jgi:hypothetical protein